MIAKTSNNRTQRIMVIGGAGSGKSTLALKIREITRAPIVHIDRIYWTEGWVPRDLSEARELVTNAAQRDLWIFDGNNSSTFKERADRADAIVFLDVPTWLRFCRVVWRTARSYGRSRPDMADGCRERIDFAFLMWVLKYRSNGGRAKAMQLIKNYASSAKTYHLRSRHEVDRFLSGLKAHCGDNR